MFVGSCIGYFFTGYFCDKIGRKSTMLVGNIMTFFIFLATALSTEYWHIAVLKFLYGFVIALTAISTLMICEISTKEIRGRLLVLL